MSLKKSVRFEPPNIQSYLFPSS